jgi:hypothetical protein
VEAIANVSSVISGQSSRRSRPRSLKHLTKVTIELGPVQASELGVRVASRAFAAGTLELGACMLSADRKMFGLVD